jgi:hypothetical protein
MPLPDRREKVMAPGDGPPHAEGVRKAAELRVCREMGFNLLQGYIFFGK